jgi:hypothetical protein
MAAERRFRIPDTVIHQTIDGEAVVINLDNGRYYAFNQRGSLLWNALAAGHSDAAVAAGSTGAERAAIDRFVDELVEQGLVHDAGAHSRSAAAPLPEITAALGEPRMEIYTDMERLLPLDPLHEVDERGWPNRKAGPS